MARISTDQRIEPSFGESRRRPVKTKRASGKSGKRVKSGKSTRSSKKQRSGIGLLGALRRLFYWCLVVGLWGGIAAVGIIGFYAAQLPQSSTWAVPERPPNVKIVSLDGRIIANRGMTGGEAVRLGQMSPYIPQALIAIEDRRFRQHFGVDPFGLLRAGFKNLLAGKIVEGGSTITQQLAKNLFLKPERTLRRKVQEVILAFWLEAKFSKDEILEIYLNRVYFGSGAYGVDAAARRYFKKTPRQVNLAEAALLAGLLKAPSRLSPARNSSRAEHRAQLVLTAMRRSGFINDREAATALSATPNQVPSYWSGAENYVADWVMEDLESLVGEITGNIVVETTLDFGLQKAAEATIRKVIKARGKRMRVSQAALVTLDLSGAVRAMVGGRDYTTSQFNRAKDAKRQPGSAFKPFVYLAALERGYDSTSVLVDQPMSIGKWRPKNYHGKYYGAISLKTAFSKSLNTVAAQLVVEIGPQNVVAVARRLGITSTLKANPSIALGTSEVSLLELTSAYVPLVNGGYRAPPYVINRITGPGGKLLYQRPSTAAERVVSRSGFEQMNDMMVEVVANGTGQAAQLPNRRVGGKTGTTQEFRDGWFIGFTGSLITGVWFGNDNGGPTKRVTGGSLPAITWRALMLSVDNNGGFLPQLGNQQQFIELPANVAVPTRRPGYSKPSPADRIATRDRPIPPSLVGQPSSKIQSKSIFELILGQKRI